MNTMSINEKREFVTNLLENQHGKFFTVEFVGVNGDFHKINGRLHVAKFSHGGKNPANGKPHLVTAFNVQKMQYRNINLDGVTKIHAGNQEYIF
jgi:hypothetical protein